MANLGYILWTLWMVGYHFGLMQLPGLIYFFGELSIIGFLCHLEWRIASQMA